MFSKKTKTNVYSLITEQNKDVEACLINFEGFMRAAVTPETVPETLRSLSVGISQMEAAADRSLRRMIDSLTGAYLPSTREDLISIATSCDRVANKCEHTALMMVYQQFRFPKEYADEIVEIVTVTREQFELLKTAIGKLFSKFGELLRDHAILDEIREKESRVDEIEQRLYERIFAMDLDLAHRTQIARIVELTCDTSDIIENIADQIQIMLITRKA